MDIFRFKLSGSQFIHVAVIANRVSCLYLRLRTISSKNTPVTDKQKTWLKGFVSNRERRDLVLQSTGNVIKDAIYSNILMQLRQRYKCFAIAGMIYRTKSCPDVLPSFRL